MLRGWQLRAFGPPHERDRLHRRSAPAPRPRERREVRGPQPPQHLLLKEEVGQGPEHGAEQQRRGRVVWRRGRHQIVGPASRGEGGGVGSRAARGYLCERALPSWLFAGPPPRRLPDELGQSATLPKSKFFPKKYRDIIFHRWFGRFSLPFPSLPFSSLPCPSLPFPSLPFPSLPFPALPFPSLPFPCLPFPSLTFFNLLQPSATIQTGSC